MAKRRLQRISGHNRMFVHVIDFVALQNGDFLCAHE